MLGSSRSRERGSPARPLRAPVPRAPVRPRARALGYVLATAAALLSSTGCRPRRSGAVEGDVVIGVVAALTGPSAVYGVPMRDGIQLALEEHGEGRGAIAGRKLRAVYLDDRSRSSEAVLVAQRLIVDERAVLLLGGVSSAGAIAIAPIVERAHVPLITPSATERGVTEHGEHVFRVCFVDPFQAEVMARFARQDLRLERVAVLRDLDSEYSSALARAFADAFTRRGGRITEVAEFAHDGEDFGALLERVAAGGPEALYLPAYAADVEKIARAARARAAPLVLLGADGFDTARLIEAGGGLLDGSYFTTHYSEGDPRPEVQRFARAFAAKLNERPSAHAALGYDAAALAIAAIERVGTADRGELRRALASTSRFQGLTGDISFDPARNAIKPAVIIEVRGSERRFVARVAPE